MTLLTAVFPSSACQVGVASLAANIHPVTRRNRLARITAGLEKGHHHPGDRQTLAVGRLPFPASRVHAGGGKFLSSMSSTVPMPTAIADHSGHSGQVFEVRKLSAMTAMPRPASAVAISTCRPSRTQDAQQVRQPS